MEEPQLTALEREKERKIAPGTRGERSPAPRRRGRGWIWFLVFLGLAAAAYYMWSKRPAAPKAPANAPAAKGAGGPGRGFGAIPVVAVKARKGDIGVYDDGLGAVTPINTVLVRSRVDGELLSVHYKEGDLVQKGALLAEIDPRPFQVQLVQAEGQLIRDKALLDNAKVDLARYETLIKQNAVPEQQLATQKALITQYEGTVKADQGAIDAAKLDIVYSHITAPLSGRIGLRLVDPGNIVHATDTNGMLVITQLQPVSVIFTIAEDQLPAVIHKYQAGAHLRVDAYNRDSLVKLASGTLTTIDNQIDPSTGTLKLRAVFDNSRNELFPNQFVNARLLVEQKRGVTLLPTATIQRNNQMTYVWAVKPDGSVTVRKIETGVTEGPDTEVTSGLEAGDTVVMTGVDKLHEGSKVNAQFAGSGQGRGGAPSPGSGQGTGSWQGKGGASPQTQAPGQAPAAGGRAPNAPESGGRRQPQAK